MPPLHQLLPLQALSSSISAVGPQVIQTLLPHPFAQAPNLRDIFDFSLSLPFTPLANHF